jgi:protein phosphatase
VIDAKELVLKPETGDLYLIATDGLTDMVSPERMEEILKSNESTRVAEALLAETLKNGGRDNVTFIVMYLINH